ncbi:Acetyl-coenzyme A synthetase [Pseudomonas fluorescens]|uniref:Acetyl-coenzyme A synthetase n=1 Tax=Pseudomonas fluorescens TaxID=294 RepID=A0A5E7TVM5_PSEFL|nr:Acetyl-coenzyme A synthetase [Pseudomonas fluorescens]VVQ03143.1 Acetyl-coenzyme A synthetase [Pseudomonas fluorescens]
MTHERVFDYRPGEVYWCTADVGWITGHTYIVYGPLANGATTLLFEGVPNYPDITRVAKIVDKHKVNILYTPPTAIRAMMASGTAAVEGADGSSLRLLGSVGEPINPEARACGRRAQRVRPPYGHRRDRKRDGRPPESRRGGGGRCAA